MFNICFSKLIQLLFCMCCPWSINVLWQKFRSLSHLSNWRRWKNIPLKKSRCVLMFISQKMNNCCLYLQSQELLKRLKQLKLLKTEQRAYLCSFCKTFTVQKLMEVVSEILLLQYEIYRFLGNVNIFIKIFNIVEGTVKKKKNNMLHLKGRPQFYKLKTIKLVKKFTQNIKMRCDMFFAYNFVI